MHKKILISVIILNYFGEKVIQKTIDSVINSNFDKNKLEIIVVDNASKDKSISILKKIKNKYKNNYIRIIYSDKNLGFAGGNNLGIKAAQGKYVVLLNNDCIVDRQWLLELYKSAQKDKRIFAVGSKINLYPKYIYLKLDGANFQNVKKVLLTKSQLISYTKEQNINLNFYIKKNLVIEIPFDYFFDKNIEITIFCYSKIGDKDFLIDNSYKKHTIFFKKGKKLIIKIKIDKFIKEKSVSKIQNFGNLIFQNGYGRDIGAIVRYNRQYYENDFNQYDREVERYAACGAAVLYRKSVFKTIGLLNENYFMYYEDVDICERARFHGFKTVYNPKAKVFHLHAFSSKEWSEFFIYHAEKGRLLNLFFNFPFFIFIGEFLNFTFKSLIRLIIKTKNIKTLIMHYQYIKIVFFFLAKFFYLLHLRNKALKKVKNQIFINYKKILSGYWLFQKTL